MAKITGDIPRDVDKDASTDRIKALFAAHLSDVFALVSDEGEGKGRILTYSIPYHTRHLQIYPAVNDASSYITIRKLVGTSYLRREITGVMGCSTAGNYTITKNVSSGCFMFRSSYGSLAILFMWGAAGETGFFGLGKARLYVPAITLDKTIESPYGASLSHTLTDGKEFFSPTFMTVDESVTHIGTPTAYQYQRACCSTRAGKSL